MKKTIDRFSNSNILFKVVEITKDGEDIYYDPMVISECELQPDIQFLVGPIDTEEYMEINYSDIMKIEIYDDVNYILCIERSAPSLYYTKDNPNNHLNMRIK